MDQKDDDEMLSSSPVPVLLSCFQGIFSTIM